jgi:hypothetical protein
LHEEPQQELPDFTDEPELPEFDEVEPHMFDGLAKQNTMVIWYLYSGAGLMR